METKILKISDFSTINEDLLKSAIILINNGQIVGFPTETVYGLGASIYSDTAIKQIFEVKGRPQDNPLIVHISSMQMLYSLIDEVSDEIIKICETFWPGPLTILFKKSNKISDLITTGLSTVAIRMPSHPVAKALIEYTKSPIAAPSANLSGRPSPTTAEHVYHDLNGKIPLIIDSGMANIGVESTVVDFFRDPPMILRPGGINYEDLRLIVPNIQVYEKTKRDEKLELKPSTPGLKYKHYSPKAYVILIEKREHNMGKIIQTTYLKIKSRKKKVGLIHTHSDFSIPQDLQNDPDMMIIDLSLPHQLKKSFQSISKEVAQQLFLALREFDKNKIEIVLVEGIHEKFEGLAVMNRLRKAASEII